MPFVTRADCISAAAAALVKPGLERRVLNITGPDLMTFPEMAQVIAEVAGASIEWADVDSQSMYAFFDKLGSHAWRCPIRQSRTSPGRATTSYRWKLH